MGRVHCDDWPGTLCFHWSQISHCFWTSSPGLSLRTHCLWLWLQQLWLSAPSSVEWCNSQKLPWRHITNGDMWWLVTKGLYRFCGHWHMKCTTTTCQQEIESRHALLLLQIWPSGLNTFFSFFHVTSCLTEWIAEKFPHCSDLLFHFICFNVLCIWSHYLCKACMQYMYCMLEWNTNCKVPVCVAGFICCQSVLGLEHTSTWWCHIKQFSVIALLLGFFPFDITLHCVN